MRDAESSSQSGPATQLCDELGQFSDIITKVQYEFERRDLGLTSISRELDQTCLPPRKSISVLLLGNHSAGKSSFINWFVGERVQTESTAMETAGFTFVSHGKQRGTYRGPATVRRFPFIHGIDAFTGVMDYLSAEIVPVRDSNPLFQFVDLIDTPGLTDGRIEYPFDIDSILVWLADRVDLVLVFFDPHGQAMIERTMNVVKKLKEVQTRDKLHFLLSKADTIPTQAERLKVISQLSQNLSTATAQASNVRYFGKHAMDIKVIYRPPRTVIQEMLEDASRADHDYNQVSEIVGLLQSNVKQMVQRHCEELEKAACLLRQSLASSLEQVERDQRKNKMLTTLRSAIISLLFSLLAMALMYNLHVLISLINGSTYGTSTQTTSEGASQLLLSCIRFLLGIVSSTCDSVGSIIDRGSQSRTIVAILAGLFWVMFMAVCTIDFLIKDVADPDTVSRWEVYAHHLDAHLLHPTDGQVTVLWNRFLQHHEADSSPGLCSDSDSTSPLPEELPSNSISEDDTCTPPSVASPSSAASLQTHFNHES